jgi:hypothetical protein
MAALLTMNAVLGCLTGAAWFLLAEPAGCGYAVGGVLMGLAWLLVAIGQWLGKSRDADVGTSTRGGVFEWATSNTWTVLGVVEAGFLGGIAGYLGYTLIMPAAWLIGRFSGSARPQTAGLAWSRISLPRKYVANLAQEIPSIFANVVIIALYVLIYHLWISKGTGGGSVSNVRDYLVTTASFFIWSALCVGALTSRSRGRS